MLAYIDQTEWASFHVDLVGSDIIMTGTPEDVPPLARVAIPDVEQHGYRAYPLVDHIADKIASMFPVQEGLANVRKHAGARRAEVVIGERAGTRFVTVRDDGKGLTESDGAGQGLKNLQEDRVDRRRADGDVEAGLRHRARSRPQGLNPPHRGSAAVPVR